MSNRDHVGASSPGQVETLFATPEWFAIWSDAFGQENYSVWRPAGAQQNLAIPCCRQHIKIAGVSLPIVRGAANHYTPRYDVIMEGEESVDLDRILGDLDVACVEFNSVSDHSRLVRGIDGHRPSWPVQVDMFEQAPFIDCTLEWDSYWASRGKNTRSKLRSIERKLHQSQVEIVRLEDWKDIDPLRQTLYDVEASGWKGRQGTAMAQNESVKTFYDRLMYEFAKRGFLRVFLLKIDGEVIAFELTTLYRGVLSSLKVGFRESHSDFSPGQILRYRFLPWAFAEPGVLFYDMLGPWSETKMWWATGVETLLTVRAFRRSLGGGLCRARFVAGPRIKAYLGKAAAHSKPA